MRHLTFLFFGLLAGALVGCGIDTVPLPEMNNRASGKDGGGDSGNGGSGGSGWEPPCNGGCSSGFHCEYDTCIPNAPPTEPTGAGRDPLTSNRYVFSLETEARRLLRIDSVSLEVEAFNAGLAPLTLAIVGSRELSILLDGFELVEVLDHRQEPPVAAAWQTAIKLSHVALSPTGEHAILYYDWDDPEAAERQPNGGNINEVSVLYLGDGDQPFDDTDPRLIDVGVGYMPRDVRFSADGSRAVVIGKDTLTPLVLGSPFEVDGAVAQMETQIYFDESAVEILVDADAQNAVMRYLGSNRAHIIDLAAGAVTCFETVGTISDFAFAKDGQLVTVANNGGFDLALAPLSSASPEPCSALVGALTVPDAKRIAIDPTSDYGVMYVPSLAVEEIWRIDFSTMTASVIGLEKAVAAIAFAGDGRHLLLSNLKAPGEPLWDSSLEDPEVSVDKAYGVTWVDLETTHHRLAVSDYPFGDFTFVPAAEGQPSATYQAVQDPSDPRLLRVTHEPGFDDLRLELAAMPLKLGYLPETELAFVTQDHPWGRVTFIDASGEELRHVTGFAMEVLP